MITTKKNKCAKIIIILITTFLVLKENMKGRIDEQTDGRADVRIGLQDMRPHHEPFHEIFIEKHPFLPRGRAVAWTGGQND